MLDGAPNYVEMVVSEADSPNRYVVRVQRAEGKTPHEARQEAEARARAAEARVVELEERFAALSYRRWLAWQSARRGRAEATVGLNTVLDDLFREEAYAKELEDQLADIRAIISDAL
jgi:hypothetical protein